MSVYLPYLPLSSPANFSANFLKNTTDDGLSKGKYTNPPSARFGQDYGFIERNLLHKAKSYWPLKRNSRLDD